MSGWKKLPNFERISIRTIESNLKVTPKPDQTKKLNNTITGLICRYLSYPEKYVFSITSRHINNICNIAKSTSRFADGTKHNLNSEIIRRLSDPSSGFIYKGTNIKPILEFLEKNDIYLTGGALLQILNGEKLSPYSDFDFILMQPTSIKKSQHLSTIYKTFKNIRSPPNNEIPPSIYPIEPDPHEAKMYRIINNMNRHHELAGEAGYPFFPLEIANVYDEHLRTVQLSIITEKNYKSVNEYIYHTADFDFTAISWSFKHKRLWTRNFDSIILKKCSFNISDIRWVNAFGCGTETLIAMEMEENDDIDEEELKDTYSLHNMQTMLTRCKIRKIKYEHRGYSIKIEDQEAIEKFYEENE